MPGGQRIKSNDFSAVIAQALQCEPLADDKRRDSTIGFHHSVILSLADQVIAAVKNGDVKHVYLIGGCDGAEQGRNYYTQVAQRAPESSLILTLGCGKFRIREGNYGTVAGLPRFLDMGQCNDAYGAIKVASALAEAFHCGVNDLPLTLVLSWFEQKAIVILLTLLSLGVKDIRTGPTAPAFLTPALLKVLEEQFGLKGTTTAEADLAEILAA